MSSPVTVGTDAWAAVVVLVVVVVVVVAAVLVVVELVIRGAADSAWPFETWSVTV
jgi:hypothetical protein